MLLSTSMKDEEKSCLTAVETLLLPHLDTLDLHLARVLLGTLFPGWKPLVAGVPEFEWSVGSSVNPWLAGNVVLEPSIGTADGNVEDKVEVLVERSSVGTASPWVLKRGTVAGGRWEVALGPEWLVEVDVHDLKKTRVDIGEDVLLRPLDSKSVEAGGVGGVECSTLYVVAVPAILGWDWTPVKSRGDNVVTTLWVGVVVTARLHDVNLARARPRTVDGVGWQHPDGRPQPVTGRELCLDLDTSELDVGTELGVDTTRLDRVDNSTVCGVGGDDTVGVEGGGASAIGQEVDGGTVRLDELCGLESWLDDHHAVLDVDVLVSVGGDLELSVSERNVSSCVV